MTKKMKGVRLDSKRDEVAELICKMQDITFTEWVKRKIDEDEKKFKKEIEELKESFLEGDRNQNIGDE